MAYMFDFYHGGRLDITFLGFREVDQYGNVNVSRMGDSIPGVGGFIDISQNTKKIVFCSAFNAKGLAVEMDNGNLNIKNQGTVSKFSDKVQQISFSGKKALEEGKTVMYITERAVFQLTAEGMELIEYAPGVDIEKDILPYMSFKPIVKNPKLMEL
jgi:propionate CoA-transferase